MQTIDNLFKKANSVKDEFFDLELYIKTKEIKYWTEQDREKILDSEKWICFFYILPDKSVNEIENAIDNIDDKYIFSYPAPSFYEFDGEDKELHEKKFEEWYKFISNQINTFF